MDLSISPLGFIGKKDKELSETLALFTNRSRWEKNPIAEIIRVDSSEKLKQLMPKLVAKLKEPKEFKEFYRYIFMFAKDSDQKCMLVDVSQPFLFLVIVLD